MKEHKVDSLGMYLGIFGALMVFTFLTVTAAYIDFGQFSVTIAIAIATIKAILVIWFFMHVQHGSGLLKLFVLAGFLSFFLLIIFTLSDYATRPSAEIEQNSSWIKREASHYQTKSQPAGYEPHGSIGHSKEVAAH